MKQVFSNQLYLLNVSVNPLISSRTHSLPFHFLSLSLFALSDGRRVCKKLNICCSSDRPGQRLASLSELGSRSLAAPVMLLALASSKDFSFCFCFLASRSNTIPHLSSFFNFFLFTTFHETSEYVWVYIFVYIYVCMHVLFFTLPKYNSIRMRWESMCKWRKSLCRSKKKKTFVWETKSKLITSFVFLHFNLNTFCLFLLFFIVFFYFLCTWIYFLSLLSL